MHVVVGTDVTSANVNSIKTVERDRLMMGRRKIALDRDDRVLQQRTSQR